MSESLLNELIVGFGIGLAFLLSGCVNLLFHSRRPSATIVMAICASVAGGSLPAAYVPFDLALVSIVCSILGVTVVFVLGSNRLVITKLLGLICRPVAQSLFLILAGGAAVSLSITQLSSSENESDELDLELMSVPPHASLQIVKDKNAGTDLGRSLTLREPIESRSSNELLQIDVRTVAERFQRNALLRLQPASDRSNCHGWVFTGGQYWIGPEDVELILEDNGYESVSDPRTGDLVIYRDHGKIVHSAIVHSAIPGHAVLVEGKWAYLSVFLHSVDDSCYGRVYNYYRSHRSGHVLAGLIQDP